MIVSAGAIGSPQMLQLSGIGDPEHLKRAGIEPVAASPGVGRNLSDHYVARLVARLRGLETLNELSRGLRLVREVIRFGLFGNGALTMGVTSAMVFCRSREGLESPDIQLLFTPASYIFGKALVLEDDPGMTIAVCPTRPSSRGSRADRYARSARQAEDPLRLSDGTGRRARDARRHGACAAHLRGAGLRG